MRRLLARLLGLAPKPPKDHPPPVFRDLDGIQYYGWPTPGDLPPKRFEQVQDIMVQIDASCTRKNLKEIAEGAMAQLGIASRSNKVQDRDVALQRAGFLLNELIVRPERIVPEECYYALAAICCVRHDENPYTFDVRVQAEKMETFRLAGRAGHVFFTVGVPRMLLGRLLTSKEGLRQLQASWTRQEHREQAVWNVFRGRSDDASPGGSGVD